MPRSERQLRSEPARDAVAVTRTHFPDGASVMDGFAPGGHLQLPAVQEPHLRRGTGPRPHMQQIATSTRQVEEGMQSCASIEMLAERAQIEMPIVAHIADVVAGRLTPDQATQSLLSREAMREWE